jgi:hypothetical protein
MKCLVARPPMTTTCLVLHRKLVYRLLRKIESVDVSTLTTFRVTSKKAKSNTERVTADKFFTGDGDIERRYGLYLPSCRIKVGN